MIFTLPGLEKILGLWPIFATIIGLVATGHALLHKRDPRAATLWLGVIWLLPLIGSGLYWVLGINRLRRQALSLNRQTPLRGSPNYQLGDGRHPGAEHLEHLARLVSRVVDQPLISGNRLHPLVNGDEAFPIMLQEIERANHSIALCSYIFDNDLLGQKFVLALQAAVHRGVQVRVLVDAAGVRYSCPSITGRLRQAGVPHALFLPASLFTPWRVATLNLRNHRKLLVVDGQTAFTGGMNLRRGNLLAENPPHPVRDLHFELQGPVVEQLQEAFANDWNFTTGETLFGEIWFPRLEFAGAIVARVITDGPDGDLENLQLTLLAALSEAQTSVLILTPYFLPDTILISALTLAALRGVRVDIVLPEKNNLPFVNWASRAMWWQVVQRGCRIWLTPPPFDHSKLMIVDHHWVLLGSANWDARSLRLNFELNVEAYGRDFAQQMDKIVQEKISTAHEVTLAEIGARSLPIRLRDAAARLFSPYL